MRWFTVTVTAGVGWGTSEHKTSVPQHKRCLLYDFTQAVKRQYLWELYKQEELCILHSSATVQILTSITAAQDCDYHLITWHLHEFCCIIICWASPFAWRKTLWIHIRSPEHLCVLCACMWPSTLLICVWMDCVGLLLCSIVVLVMMVEAFCALNSLRIESLETHAINLFCNISKPKRSWCELSERPCCFTKQWHFNSSNQRQKQTRSDWIHIGLQLFWLCHVM